MAKIAVSGAGFASHTMALYLGKHHSITEIMSKDKFWMNFKLYQL